MTLIALVFPKLRTPKTLLDKCLKSPVSEDPSTNNMVNVPKQCWNLHRITCITFIDHCQVNWLGKSFSYWHAKSWDWLLIHRLPMKSILLFIETIQRYQSQMQLSKKQKHFSVFFLAFLKSRLDFEHFEKQDYPHSFCIFKVTDPENVVR